MKVMKSVPLLAFFTVVLIAGWIFKVELKDDEEVWP